MSHSSKLTEPKQEVMEPISSWSGAKVTTWTFNWHLKWRVGSMVVGEEQSCRTETLTYRILILDDFGWQWLEARF